MRTVIGLVGALVEIASGANQLLSVVGVTSVLGVEAPIFASATSAAAGATTLPSLLSLQRIR